MRCVVGDWITTLDADDQQAFDNAAENMARAELHRTICEVFDRPYGITALKAHANGVCCCD
jgi:hypothetical protein